MSTSGRKNIAAKFQGPSERHINNEAQGWENQIQLTTGVVCSIKIRPDKIVIYAKDARDYFLARSVVVKRSGLNIVQG